MDVGKTLRLYALYGVDNEQSAFAGGKRAGDFIREIDMAWRIDKINLIHFPIFGGVIHRDRVRFNRDASFPFKIHRIEHLLLHFAGRESVG
jgi:hypothetical protein